MPKPYARKDRLRATKGMFQPIAYDDDGGPIYSADIEDQLGEQAEELMASILQMPKDAPNVSMPTADSLVNLPDQSANVLRLPNQVYTREQLLEAIRVLKPNGKLQITNATKEVIQREAVKEWEITPRKHIVPIKPLATVIQPRNQFRKIRHLINIIEGLTPTQGLKIKAVNKTLKNVRSQLSRYFSEVNVNKRVQMRYMEEQATLYVFPPVKRAQIKTHPIE